MNTLRIGSFVVSYDASSLVIDSITFASSGEQASFRDVKKDSDRHIGDGKDVDVFGFDMTNSKELNGIMYTGGANYVVDYEVEEKIINDED